MMQQLMESLEQLQKTYAGKTDEELAELAAVAYDLIDPASQVLRAEIAKRGLKITLKQAADARPEHEDPDSNPIRRIAFTYLIAPPLFMIISLLAILLAPVVIVLYWLHRMALYGLIWLLWLPRGKDVLLVYSDSTIWYDYMTTQVVPFVQNRAVILNWSERRKWSKWSFPVHVFRSFGGTNEFNPMVAVFRPFRRVRMFRFWAAFKEWKHGDTEPVTRLREDLLQSL